VRIGSGTEGFEITAAIDPNAGAGTTCQAVGKCGHWLKLEIGNLEKRSPEPATGVPGLDFLAQCRSAAWNASSHPAGGGRVVF
jgi:hypothetical protein